MMPLGKQILWVDDEIDLLKPHLLFLQARGYHTDAITNGDDALVLMRENAYDLRFPVGKMGVTYALAVDDDFFVYPTQLREYQRRYRNSFLHGGISPEEMIVPTARLAPRSRGAAR